MALGNTLLKLRAERMLEKGIETRDMDKVMRAIDMGARSVSYSRVHHSMYGAGKRLETQDPLELASWKNWPQADRDALSQALSRQAPEIGDVSIWEAVVGGEGLVAQEMSQRQQDRLTKRLGQAILDKDEQAIAQALDAGATRVDMKQTYSAYGGTSMIKRVQDPVEFAQEVGLPGPAIDLLRSRLETAPAPSDPAMR